MLALSVGELNKSNFLQLLHREPIYHCIVWSDKMKLAQSI